MGGGLIGVEACEALKESGIDVTMVEMAPDILTFLDPQLAGLAANHIKSKGVEVITGKGVKAFLGEAGNLAAVKLQDDTIIYCETAVVATGVQPNVELAREAGLT